MRPLLILPAILLPAPALAHLGHVADVAVTGGHDHWIALGALGVAAGIALWGALKGDDAAEDEADDGTEAEAEEQPA